MRESVDLFWLEKGLIKCAMGCCIKKLFIIASDLIYHLGKLAVCLP